MTVTGWTTEAKGTGQYAEVNGINLYFATYGTGRPLILLHGGLGSGEMFGPVIPALAERHHVIAVDLQGHGRTADIDRPIDQRLMADDIAALIDHLRLDKPDLVGYSLGGGVALHNVGAHATAWWTGCMRFGVHLPLMDFDGERFAIERLVEYVETATALGFKAISANDHLVFSVPWLDGPTALAAVVSCSGDARLFTTVANPVVRGPATLAKVVAGLDVLSGGRVVVGLGPGSSDRDYACVGVSFAERWERFDEAVLAMRALLQGRSFDGRFYAIDDALEPVPTQPNGPPLWIGSWGSDAGLRRAVRLGDGWLASAYNITPKQFADRWAWTQKLLDERGRHPADFANGVATMWFHVDDRRAGDVLDNVLAPVMHRPVEQLRERLAFGPAEVVAERLIAFRDAGVQQMFVWPVVDEIDQLHRFHEEVMVRLDA